MERSNARPIPQPARGASAGPASRATRLTARILTASLLLAAAGLPTLPRQAAAGPLETVKQNPTLARSLCDRFRALNKAGESATSAQSIALVASEQALPPMDAEVLITYVIGLHCPEVR